MPTNSDSLNNNLYNLLKTRGFKPQPKDSTGKTIPLPSEADVFKFDFKDSEGKVLDSAWITIEDGNTLKVYYDDDVMAVSESEDMINEFTQFLVYLKNWAQSRQLGFELENEDHLASDMAKRDYMKKENILEGYYPMGRNASYNDSVPTVKIILQHNRQIQEGEQRFRHIAKIFLENTEGERILAPTIRPGIAQVYARHLAEGGVPNDERWNHIKSLCEEYSKMAGFVRAVRNNQFNETAQKLVEAGLNHYSDLRETLGKMRGHRGYNMYFESWTPTLMETEGDETNLNELFVQETLDPRIECVMPILNRLKINLGEMKEVQELEEWANNLTEAPGAETLAHNEKTAASNLKAFGLAEEELEEALTPAELARIKIQKPAFQRTRPDQKLTTTDLRTAGMMPEPAPQDPSSGLKISGKDDLAKLKKDTGINEVEIEENGVTSPKGISALTRRLQATKKVNEEEVEESGLQAYLGNKKYGKEGMDALRKAGREGASKEKMAKIRAKYDKLDEQDVAEGKDWDQAAADRANINQKLSLAKTDPLTAAKDLLGPMFRSRVSFETEKMLNGLWATVNQQQDLESQAVEFIQKLQKQMSQQGVAEDLDANQKRVGQLGPTEKVKNNNIGKLVGANESVEPKEGQSDLEALLRLIK